MAETDDTRSTDLAELEVRDVRAVDYDDDGALMRAIRRRLSDAAASELQQPGIWAGAIAELAQAYTTLGGRLELEPDVELVAARARRDYLQEHVDDARNAFIKVNSLLQNDTTLRTALAEYDATGELAVALDELAAAVIGTAA